MTEITKDTSSQIKAIETQYKGYRFRSRLEARWAIYFDNTFLTPRFAKAYHIPENKPYITWEYEQEGFELSNGDRYLPDFYLRPYNCYAEVKGESLTQKQSDLLFKFVRETNYPLLLLIGTPDAIPFTLINKFINLGSPCDADAEVLSNEIDRCHATCGRLDFKNEVSIPKDITISCVCFFDYAGIKESRFYVMPCGDEFKTFDNLTNNPINAARRARFEHGEHP